MHTYKLELHHLQIPNKMSINLSSNSIFKSLENYASDALIALARDCMIGRQQNRQTHALISLDEKLKVHIRKNSDKLNAEFKFIQFKETFFFNYKCNTHVLLFHHIKFNDSLSCNISHVLWYQNVYTNLPCPVEVFRVICKVIQGQESIGIAGHSMAYSITFAQDPSLPDHLSTTLGFFKVLGITKCLCGTRGTN